MYSKEQFGRELKMRLKERQDAAEIGHWSYSIYLKYIDDIDLEFRELLLTLNTMEDGPEFILTYDELNFIADNLILGKIVKI